MPVYLKFVLSVIVCAVAVAMFAYESGTTRAHLGYVALGLGAFMIFAVWLFPEARRKEPGGP